MNGVEDEEGRRKVDELVSREMICRLETTSGGV